MNIMKVTAVAPKAVSTNSVRRCVLHVRFEAECERDRIQRWRLLDLGDRDGQASPTRLPSQGQEWAALTLNGEQPRDELHVHMLVQVDHQALRAALNQACL
jgi:hypothetical protein